MLPGSAIIGPILFFLSGNSVRFGGGNHNLTFGVQPNGLSAGGATPFAIVGNRAAGIDPTPFAMADRSLMDFSRGVSGSIPAIDGASARAGSAAGTALAAAPAEDGFRGMLDLGARRRRSR